MNHLKLSLALLAFIPMVIAIRIFWLTLTVLLIIFAFISGVLTIKS